MLDGQGTGIVAALGSAASWSLGTLLFNRVERLSAFALTLVKGVMSVALLAALAFAVERAGGLDALSFAYLAASGVLGIAIADTLFFAALQSIGPRALVLVSTLGQVFTVLLAVVLLGEPIGPRELGGVALVLAGVAAGVFPDPSAPRTQSARGILLGIASVLCMSVSAILTKQGVRSASTVDATLVRMAAGTAGMVVVGALTGQLGPWLAPVRHTAVLGQLFVAVCVITFGGFWLTVVAFKYSTVTVASSLIATEPLFILPLSALFLRERITTRAVTGAAVATAGVVVLCTSGGGP